MIRRPALAVLAIGLSISFAPAQSAFCDLQVSSLQTNSTEFAGGAPLRVTFSVRNASGTLCPRASKASLRLSSDSVFSGDDIKLADVVIPALLPNSAKAYTLDVRVPYCIVPGTRYLVVRADSDAEVPESIEVNNELAISRSSTAWKGDPRIEYYPILEQGPSLEVETVSAWDGGRKRMCLTAPGRLGDWYLVVWSGSRNFQIDAFTAFSLELINTQFQPRWLSNLTNETRAFPDYWMPSGIRFTGSFRVFVSAWFANSSFTRWTGRTGNSIELTITG